MGLTGIFKENSYKQEIETLNNRISELTKLFDNVGKDNIENIAHAKETLQNLDAQILSKEKEIERLQKTILQKNTLIAEKQSQISALDDEIIVQDFGLYKPRFAFASALDYKEALAKIRDAQKQLIKTGKAATGNTKWTVNGSQSKGQKMINDLKKLFLRAFNSECDELVNKVKYTNFDASLKRLYSIAESISKLGKDSVGISITPAYMDLKIKELRLALEYQIKKQEEKEALRQARAAEREFAKLQKEIAEQRKAIYKEQHHYERALSELNKMLISNPDNPDLIEKRDSVLKNLSGIEKSLSDIDYREANQRAGYVYIISNIGAFGENIYKIGMTRRLDPQERIDELGDASVPFNFDVHAMIFSDDAPALETALHKAFEDKKLNMVNSRREFFNVSLDEIKDVIRKNFDKTVEFVDVPDAEQYRISLKMKAGKL